MELETQVQQHENKLKQHDKEISRLNERSLAMQKTIDASLIRVDESNKYLREQNTRQSEQNTEILSAVLDRNKRSAELDHELKLIDKTNMWKVVIGIGGSAGVVFAFIMELLKFFWR